VLQSDNGAAPGIGYDLGMEIAASLIAFAALVVSWFVLPASPRQAAPHVTGELIPEAA